ncbi:YARHG domain-containing protein [Neobacillus sp. NPDC093127]|uniref:YARHG domain-containing protein n=1 Tax=Neobacillus sp. NPDC093127 TaxID=3364296 RepID=UPI0038156525
MAKFCTNCGKELKIGQVFCNGCGTKVGGQRTEYPGNVSATERTTFVKQTKNKQNRNLLITVLSIVGVLALLVGAYFIVTGFKETKPQAVSHDVTSGAKDAESDSVKADTKEEKAAENDEETILKNYARKLNSLKINASGSDISLGKWDITNRNGTLFLEANNIPSRNLTRIFDLYDSGEQLPLKDWAKEVYFIADDLSGKLKTKWNIEVGNGCVSDYPITLSQADLMDYSGSCGYSIPVLSGSDKASLSLVIHSKVFGSTENTTVSGTNEFIFPHSDVRRLTESEIAPLSLEELGLARNEIFARHGHVFTKEELRVYFEQKSWYFPDSSYNDTLSPIEKYNVDLIKSREEYLK